MLLDHQHPGSRFADRIERPDQPVDENGRKTFRRLVEKDEAWIGHQRPADRQHLLLPAAQHGARPVRPFLEHRKQIVDRSQIPTPCSAGRLAEQQILFDGQIGQDTASLRRNRDPELCGHIAGHSIDPVVMHPDFAGDDVRLAKHGEQQCGFSRPVAADQGHRFPVIDGKVDAVQHRRGAIAGNKHLDAQRAHAAVPR